MRKAGGFTLVEIMVAIVVLGITIASLSSLFISIRTVQSQTLYFDTANRAAQRQIESLRNNSYSSLTPGQTIDFTDQLPNNLPDGQAVAVISQPVDGLRRVDATVTYTTQYGQTKSVVLSSLIGQIGLTQ